MIAWGCDVINFAGSVTFRKGLQVGVEWPVSEKRFTSWSLRGLYDRGGLEKCCIAKVEYMSIFI